MSGLLLRSVRRSTSAADSASTKARVTIKAGEKVMINGDHNVNRKLLFLALSELWPCGGGKIGLPPTDDMLFVPQSAYIPGDRSAKHWRFLSLPDTYQNTDVVAALEKAGLHASGFPARYAGPLGQAARFR